MRRILGLVSGKCAQKVDFRSSKSQVQSTVEALHREVYCGVLVGRSAAGRGNCWLGGRANSSLAGG